MCSNTKKFLSSIGFVICLMQFSCTKDNTAAFTDITSPFIKMTLPVQNGSYNSEGPINIIGTATDNELFDQEISVYNITDTVKVFSKKRDIKGEGVTFQENYVSFINHQVVQCVAVVKVRDKTGNTSVDSTTFVVFKP